TLINSAAPLEPPKILPNLPNVVQLQQLAAPARPRLQISQETLSKLRPRELRKVKLTAEPAPDLPTLDQKLADIAPAMLPNSAPARPKFELNAGSGGGSASSGGTGTGSGSAKNGMDVSITGGHPPANNVNSGLSGPSKISATPSRALITRPDPHTKPDDTPERTGPPNFASLPAGAQPEQIFASKKIYKMLVNMPNLNSATGSWILNFSELPAGSEVPDPGGPGAASSQVSAPG